MDRPNHETNHEEDNHQTNHEEDNNQASHEDDPDDLLSLNLYCGPRSPKRSRNSPSPPSPSKRHITDHQTPIPQIQSYTSHLDHQTPPQPPLQLPTNYISSSTSNQDFQTPPQFALQLPSNHPLYCGSSSNLIPKSIYMTNNLTIPNPCTACTCRNPSPNSNSIDITPQPALPFLRNEALYYFPSSPIPKSPSSKDNLIVSDPCSSSTRQNLSPNLNNEDKTMNIIPQPPLQLPLNHYIPLSPISKDNLTISDPLLDPSRSRRNPSQNPSNDDETTPLRLSHNPPSLIPESPSSTGNIIRNPPSRPTRPRRNRPQNPSSGDSTKTITPPYPWATNLPATIHKLSYLLRMQISTITGRVRCTKCNIDFEIGFDLKDKLEQVWDYISENQYTMHDRAPDVWMSPALPTCKYCSCNCARPIIPEDKDQINWLFLFLGQLLGCCTLEQLKYFCGTAHSFRTGAKDRVLYLAYRKICEQLVCDK